MTRTRSLPSRRPVTRLTRGQARRVALAAQGFATDRPTGVVTARQLQRVIDTVGVLQIDSVNVLSRSHYLPVFSRLGSYPRELLDRATGRSPRRLVEYWAHEASFVPPRTHTLLRWRMARAQAEAWGGMSAAAAGRPALVDAVRLAVADHGPITAAELERLLAPGGVRDRSSWGWNWSETKRVVEFLFWAGEITSAGRSPQFERRYDLPHRVLPDGIAALADPDPADAFRDLIRIAARAQGVATMRCLRDYFRLRTRDAAPAIAALIDAGELLPVTVQGWDRPTYLHAEARLPRRVAARALVSPFDSLVWQRDRAHALFDFHYRIEIYTPAAKRVHGYYVLPFLCGDRLVARVDLKADRVAGALGGGVLRVRAAWAEPGLSPDDPSELADELAELAGWLGLAEIAVEPRGDLAAALRRLVS